MHDGRYIITEGNRVVAILDDLDDAKLFLAAPQMAAALHALVGPHGDLCDEMAIARGRVALREAGLGPNEPSPRAA